MPFQPIPGRLAVSPEELIALQASDDAQEGGILATSDVEMWVDSANGSDANSGAQNAPLKTLDVALAKVPLFWTKKCRIWLVSGGSFTTTKSTYVFGGPLGSTAEPLAIVGGLSDVGLGTLTIAGGSTTTVINAGAGMVVDAYRGRRLRILTGARAGQCRLIISNTATSFTLQGALTGGAPATNDTCIVEQPNVTIAPAVTGTWSCFGRLTSTIGTGIYFVGVRLSLNNRSMNFVGGTTHATFDSCEVDFNLVNNSILGGQSGAMVLFSGNLSATFPTLSNAGSSLGGACWFHNGIANGSTGIQMISGAGGSMYLVMDKSLVWLITADVTLLNPDFRSTQLSVLAGSACSLSAGGTFDGENVSTNGLIQVAGLSHLRPGSSTYVLRNAVGDGLHVESGSVVGASSTAPASTPAVFTGTGNSGYGIRLSNGSRAVLGAGTTVTGTSGDIIVGATATTHANLTAATFVVDANHQARVSRT